MGPVAVDAERLAEGTITAGYDTNPGTNSLPCKFVLAEFLD